MDINEAHAFLTHLEGKQLAPVRRMLAERTDDESLQMILLTDTNSNVRRAIRRNPNLCEIPLHALAKLDPTMHGYITTNPNLSAETIDYILTTTKAEDYALTSIIKGIVKNLNSTPEQLIYIIKRFPTASDLPIAEAHFPIENYKKLLDLNNPRHLYGLASNPRITDEIVNLIINSPIQTFQEHLHREPQSLIGVLARNNHLKEEHLKALAPHVNRLVNDTHALIQFQKLDTDMWKLFLQNANEEFRTQLAQGHYYYGDNPVIELLAQDPNRRIRNMAQSILDRQRR